MVLQIIYFGISLCPTRVSSVRKSAPRVVYARSAAANFMLMRNVYLRSGLGSSTIAVPPIIIIVGLLAAALPMYISWRWLICEWPKYTIYATDGEKSGEFRMIYVKSIGLGGNEVDRLQMVEWVRALRNVRTLVCQPAEVTK